MRHWILLAAGAVAAGVAGCEQAAAPNPVTAAPAEAAAAPSDLAAYEGTSFAEFISAAGANYAPQSLNISDASRARLARAMGVSAPAFNIEGGGAEALVFVGCAETDCAAAAGIVAVDRATGAPFAAVRDAAGQAILVANPRLEALIEATSPANRWADPEAWANDPPEP
ncbi:MAG: hypothetical protein AB7P07_02435 [Hyphomonadaceae bacterium]